MVVMLCNDCGPIAWLADESISNTAKWYRWLTDTPSHLSYRSPALAACCRWLTGAILRRWF